MARILWPPVLRDNARPFAGASSMLARLRLSHVIICALFAAVFLSTAGHKKEQPAFDASELVGLARDGIPFVLPHLAPKTPVRIAKANRFDDRYELERHLGRSPDGSGAAAALYRDMHTGTRVLIKSFPKPHHRHDGSHHHHHLGHHHKLPSPWANLFLHELSAWPAEIPATLLLAGLEPASSSLTLSRSGNVSQASHLNTTRLGDNGLTSPHGTNLTHPRQEWWGESDLLLATPARDFFVALAPALAPLSSWSRSSSLSSLLASPAALISAFLSPLFPSWTTPRWALATTYPRAGTLADLAATIASGAREHGEEFGGEHGDRDRAAWKSAGVDEDGGREHRASLPLSPPRSIFDALHARHRPAFARLLEALAAVHRRGYCHGGVRARSVFVFVQGEEGYGYGRGDGDMAGDGGVGEGDDLSGGERWLLTDLGSVRRVAGGGRGGDSARYAPCSYMSLKASMRRLLAAAVDQVARMVGVRSARGKRNEVDGEDDCRREDVKRAVKTYLAFLRDAGGVGPEAFARELFAERAPWSRLYWDVVRGDDASLPSAADTPPSSDDDGGLPVGWMWEVENEEVLRLAVARELRCEDEVGGRWDLEQWREWWALGGLRQRVVFERGVRW